MLAAGINAALSLGEFLNKLAAIAVTASALLALTACTPQLSAEETCVDFRALSTVLGTSPSDEEIKTGMEELSNLSDRASDELRQPISDVAFVVLEELKSSEDQDKDKIKEARDRMVAGGSAKLQEACKL